MTSTELLQFSVVAFVVGGSIGGVSLMLILLFRILKAVADELMLIKSLRADLERGAETRKNSE